MEKQNCVNTEVMDENAQFNVQDIERDALSSNKEQEQEIQNLITHHFPQKMRSQALHSTDKATQTVEKVDKAIQTDITVRRVSLGTSKNFTGFGAQFANQGNASALLVQDTTDSATVPPTPEWWTPSLC